MQDLCLAMRGFFSKERREIAFEEMIFGQKEILK